jgi:transcriptional regulator with XRE-family HTH domain
MNKEKVKQRIEYICNKYAVLISTAPTDQKKEQLQKELNWEKRRVYFGAEMQRRRKEAGKTQEELAAEIGKSKSYIKQIEAGLISLHEKRETVDKLVKSLSGWSRRQAFITLGIEYEPSAETMTVSKAKEELGAALVDSGNVHQFILQALYIRTKFEMDYRKREPGDFLKSQQVRAIFLKLKDSSATEIAAAFVRIGINADLTQKQWERIFRSYKKAEGKSSLEPLELALRTVMWDEEKDNQQKKV